MTAQASQPTEPDAPVIAVLPGGPVPLVVVWHDGAVIAAGFASVDRVLALVPPAMQAPVPGDIPAVAHAWQRYLAGDLTALDHVPVRQVGSAVQQLVWRELREVPAGTPISYGELADVIGRPRAARAVGSACGANRVAPFIPCHRVVAAGGGLGGYGYGLPIKQWLLAHESGQPAVPQLVR